MLTIENLTLIRKKDLTALAENTSFSVAAGAHMALISQVCTREARLAENGLEIREI